MRGVVGRDDDPAGHRGFVSARAGHLWFDDGTRARFWGVNVAGASALPPSDVAAAMADDLARHGANLVRLHAVDHPPGHLVAVDGTVLDVPGPTLLAAGDGSIDPEALDRLHELIARCKAAGIYTYLDLLDYRQFTHRGRPAADLDGAGKPMSIFDSDPIAQQQAYAAALLTSRNPYTGLRLCDDPALALVELTNENSLFFLGWAQLPARYREDLEGRWQAWLADRHGDRTGPGSSPLPESHRPTDDPAESTRRADVRAFGGELQRAYYRQLRDGLRSIGVRVPLTACVTNDEPADLAAVVDELDLVANGSYVHHPRFDSDRVEVDDENRRIFGGVSAMAVSKVAGVPLAVREFVWCWPNPHRQGGLLQAAAYAAFQDWDVMISYAYARHLDLAPGAPPVASPRIGHLFNHVTDAARWAAFAVGSAVFLGGAVRPAPSVVELDAAGAASHDVDNPLLAAVHLTGAQRRHPVSDDRTPVGRFGGSAGPDGPPRLAYEAGRMLAAGGTRNPRGNESRPGVAPDPWYDRIVAACAGWLGQPELADRFRDGAWVSETGELTRDLERGQFRLDTPTVAALSGELAPTAAAGDLHVTTDADSLLVALLATDGSPLGSCRRALLAVVPDGAYSGQRVVDGRLLDPGVPPMRLADYAATVRHPTLASARVVAAYDAWLRPVGCGALTPTPAAWTVRGDGRAVLFELATEPEDGSARRSSSTGRIDR